MLCELSKMINYAQEAAKVRIVAWFRHFQDIGDLVWIWTNAIFRYIMTNKLDFCYAEFTLVVESDMGTM